MLVLSIGKLNELVVTLDIKLISNGLDAHGLNYIGAGNPSKHLDE